MERHTGSVAEFDDAAGYGSIGDISGRTWFFHCTAIADGSRTIDVGTTVAFEVVAGHMGQWEAADVRPVDLADRPAG